MTSGAVAGAAVFISTERLQEMVEMLQSLPEAEQQGGHPPGLACMRAAGLMLLLQFCYVQMVTH